MKYCCEALKELIEGDEETYIEDPIIFKKDGEWHIVSDINSADDGDGYIDVWTHDTEIFYCPFCGRKL